MNSFLEFFFYGVIIPLNSYPGVGVINTGVFTPQRHDMELTNRLA